MHSVHVVWRVFLVYAWILLPMLITMFRPLAKLPLDSGDILTVLLIAVPLIVNFYTFVLPEVQVKIRDGWPRISMLQITAINVGLVVFVGVRPLHDLGYTLMFGLRDFVRIIGGLLVSAILLLPIGYGTGVLKEGSAGSFSEGVQKFFVFLVLVSLPTELLFRGLIQNLLHARFDSAVEVYKYVTVWAEKLPAQPDPVGLSELEPMVKGKKAKPGSLASVSKQPGDPNISEVKFSGEMRMSLTKQGMDEKKDLEDPLKPPKQQKSFISATFSKAMELPTNITSYDEAHSKWFNRNPFCWLWIPTLRDWIVLFIASSIYAVALTDHEKWDSENAVTFALLFCLGISTGYTWRLTSKVTASAIVHALVVYIGLNVLGADIGLSLRWDKECGTCVNSESH